MLYVHFFVAINRIYFTSTKIAYSFIYTQFGAATLHTDLRVHHVRMLHTSWRAVYDFRERSGKKNASDSEHIGYRTFAHITHTHMKWHRFSGQQRNDENCNRMASDSAEFERRQLMDVFWPKPYNSKLSFSE